MAQDKTGNKGTVLGARIDALSWDAALDRLLGWARVRDSRYAAICNVHVVVSASRDAAYRALARGGAGWRGRAIAVRARRQRYCRGCWRCIAAWARIATRWGATLR